MNQGKGRVKEQVSSPSNAYSLRSMNQQRVSTSSSGTAKTEQQASDHVDVLFASTDQGFGNTVRLINTVESINTEQLSINTGQLSINTGRSSTNTQHSSTNTQQPPTTTQKPPTTTQQPPTDSPTDPLAALFSSVTPHPLNFNYASTTTQPLPYQPCIPEVSNVDEEDSDSAFTHNSPPSSDDEWCFQRAQKEASLSQNSSFPTSSLQDTSSLESHALVTKKGTNEVSIPRDTVPNSQTNLEGRIVSPQSKSTSSYSCTSYRWFCSQIPPPVDPPSPSPFLFSLKPALSTVSTMGATEPSTVVIRSSSAINATSSFAWKSRC